MGLTRRILSFFKPKKDEEVKSIHFLRNGGELQAALIEFSNGRYDIPIRSLSADELKSATNNFSEPVFANYETVMFRGHLDGRQVLVNKWTGGRNFARDEAIRDLVISAHVIHHKNVLKLLGWCLELDFPAIVYEYTGSILLSDLLDSSSDNTLLSWRCRVKIASEVASTLVYLHTAFSTPVLYRNIKPSKVIIDQYGVAKLFDFSRSISLPPGELAMEDSIKGSYGFMDPEFIRSGYVTQKSDVHDFGILLVTLLTGKIRALQDQEGETVFLTEYVRRYTKNHQYDQVIDQRILQEEGGACNWNLILSFADLALMCTRDKGEERPEMIDVAKQLRLMEKRIRDSLPTIN